MNFFDIASLTAEILVTGLGFTIAISKKKAYGWLLALTFGIYVIYDSTRFFAITISKDILSLLFFIASISILIATYLIYKKLNNFIYINYF